MSLDLVSADSHVVEPPAVYTEYLEPAWRTEAPRLVADGSGGHCYTFPGSTRSVGLGLAASAGVDSGDLKETGTAWADVRPGAWQPGPRLEDQERDGVSAEVLYPTVGLFLLRHINRELSAACAGAYNRWLAEFCRHAPGRLVGCGATAVLTPQDARRDIEALCAAGLHGAVLPLEPSVGSYADAEFDLLWATAVTLQMPLTFHALPPLRRAPAAGPAGVAVLSLWDAQELLTGLAMGGVLDRWPALRLVFAEFDAGWVPHFAQRLDHYFHRHYKWLKLDGRVTRPPSEAIAESVSFTFQDDLVAAGLVDAGGLNLLWASDFPHAESTWPDSGTTTAASARAMPPAWRERVFSQGTRTLYGLDAVAPRPAADRRHAEPPTFFATCSSRFR